MSTQAFGPPESLASRVIDFLKRNPDDSLDAESIHIKFSVPVRKVHTELGPAVAAGLLVRDESQDEVSYGLPAGKRTTKPAASGAQPHPISAVAKTPRAKHKAPFVLGADLDKIEFRTGVPVPSIRTRGDSGLSKLLDRAPVGSYCELPIEARPSLSKLRSQYKKDGKGEFVIRKLSDTTIGLWRLA